MVWISFIFFLSGLSALVYQLLWMRHLGFIFGNTVYASATVLTAFMGGLALGSHLFGRIAEKLRNPVRAFALLELAIAVYAIALPLLFQFVQHIYSLAYRHVSEDFLFLTILRFVLALLILLFPCICMGGTLPVLVRGLARDDEHFGIRMGWLYGVNTLGAVAGVALSGFYLIPAVGLSMTNIIAASTDAFAGLGALIVCGRYVIHDPTAGTSGRRFRWADIPYLAKWAIAIAMICGFTSLSLEVVWFRALILVFGSTTYSFTVMLAVFLLGIGAGSVVVAPLIDRSRSLSTLLSVVVASIGAYTLWSMYHFDQGPEYLLEHLLANKFTWLAMNRARLVIALSHLAVPALLFGAAFTIATRIVRHESDSSSRTVGFVYALNTCGAVAGSFIAGFVLLPALGMEKSLLVLAVIMMVAGGGSMVLLPGAPARRILAGSAMLAIFIYAAFFPPAWNKSMLSSGAYFAPFNFVREGRLVLREMILGDRLLHYEEALSSTVSVHVGDDELKYFCVDGKTEADQSPRSMVLQRMIGHLPLLFHPNAKKAVNIGLGAGVSFGALSCHPLDRVEVVEIEPAVQHATRVWGALNHFVLDNPRAIVTINDGRNHLFSTTNRYDVITADPFEPVMAGAAHLYTADYFQLAYNKLNDDGIMGQFLPLYEMSLEDYLTIARSFVSVFPRTALFFTGFDTILIGFKGNSGPDADVLRENFQFPPVQESLAGIGFTSPEMILSMFVADLSLQTNFISSGPINTDDHPIIEYSTPKSVLRYVTDENQKALLDNFTPIPDKWLEGLEPDVAERLQKEHEAVRLMLEASVARAGGDNENAFILLAKANEISPENPVIKNEMVAMLSVSGKALLGSGNNEEALEQFQLAINLDPKDFWSIYNLVILAMQANQIEMASDLLDHADKIYPDAPLIMGLRGKYLFTIGQQTEGLHMLMRAVRIQPGNMGLWMDLNNLAILSGDLVISSYAQQNIERIKAYLSGKS